MTEKIIHPRPNRRRPWKSKTVRVPVNVLAEVLLIVNKFKQSFKGGGSL